MNASVNRTDHLDFAQRLMGTAIDLVANSHVQLTERGARDVKVVTLSLLSRTIVNFKGVVVLLREELLVEARTLARCCYENLLWADAIRNRGDAFIDEMIEDEMGNRKSLGELILRLRSDKGDGTDSEDSKFLKQHLGTIKKQYPKISKLNVNKTAAKGAIEQAYVTYGLLSLDSVHPSISALGRHLRSEQDSGETFLSMEIVPRHRPEEFAMTLRMGSEALLGVSLVASEIFGGNKVDHALHILQGELKGFFSSEPGG